jgi:hypothetical protein
MDDLDKVAADQFPTSPKTARAAWLTSRIRNSRRPVHADREASYLEPIVAVAARLRSLCLLGEFMLMD